MLVSQAVGRALASEGVRVVFGLLGSGNLAVTNALRDAGATFVAARHETGAVCMADGYARVSGEVGCASVHQGIYNDAAYGAEVHHFRPMGHDVDLAQFPDTDFAALAQAAGCEGLTARTIADLEFLRAWLERRDRPMVLDAKVDPDICAEWLEEAFRGH